MKIRKLKSIRLVLIIIAVLLSLAIAAVKFFWIPAAAGPETPTREKSGVSSSQSEQESTSPTQTTTVPEETEPQGSTAAEDEPGFNSTTTVPTVPPAMGSDDGMNGKDQSPDGTTLGGEGFRTPEASEPEAPAVAAPNSEEENPGNPEDGHHGGNTMDQPPAVNNYPIMPGWMRPEGNDQKDEDDTEITADPDDGSDTDPEKPADPNATEPDEDATAADPEKPADPDATEPDEDVTAADPEKPADPDATEPNENVTAADPEKPADPDATEPNEDVTAANPEAGVSPNTDAPQEQQSDGSAAVTVPETQPASNDTIDGNNIDANPPEEPSIAEHKSENFNNSAKNGDVAGDVETEASVSVAVVVLYVLCALLAVDIAGIVVLTVKIQKTKSRKAIKTEKPTAEQLPLEQTVRSASGNGGIQVGQLHNIGARPYQEDSSGVSMLDDGILAIVADGMGGLSGGDKVSQKIVYTMLGYGDQLRPGYLDGALERMVHGTNEVVNNMLGPNGLYKSGSTLLAVLARDNRFHWIAVGDSHIYYFHNGHLVQLNEEHNRGQELLHMAARGEITYEEARNAPKKNGLTSFIGMGKLKYVDKSLDSIPLVPGDRILLMTDGVFNALPDQTIEAVMNTYPNVQEAAAEMERLVVQRANPRQDNFTAVIIGF